MRLSTILFVVAALISDSVVRTQDCKWIAPNGRIYDLTPLKKVGGSYNGYESATFSYAVNFCSAAIHSRCASTTSFQSIEISSSGACAGIAQSTALPDFSFKNGVDDEDGIVARFTSTTGPIKNFIFELKCGTQDYPTEPLTVVYQSTGYVASNVITKYACANVDNGDVGDSSDDGGASPQTSGKHSSVAIPVVVGVCLGFFVLSGLAFFVGKKVVDKKRQSDAADFVQEPFLNEQQMNIKNSPTGYLVLESDGPPDVLGSIFESKRPHASGPMILMETDQAESSQTHQQEIPSNSKPESTQSQESNFGKYSDITDISFSQLKPIGSGAFGLVYRVELSMGVVAVKVPKSQVDFGSKEYNSMLEEAEFLSKLRHTNITLLLGYGHHPSGSIVFLMEFANFSLYDVLKSGRLNNEELLEYAHGIVRALLYLHTHSPSISHRDLKPENVLIVGRVAKLADFGLATARDFVSKTTGFAGTPIWSPPESFEGKFPGPPGDIYTFGLLLWSMVTGKTPYEGKHINEILFMKVKNQVPEIPSDCPPDISKIVNQCWTTNPRERITAPALELAFNQIRNL